MFMLLKIYIFLHITIYEGCFDMLHSGFFMCNSLPRRVPTRSIAYRRLIIAWDVTFKRAPHPPFSRNSLFFRNSTHLWLSIQLIRLISQINLNLKLHKRDPVRAIFRTKSKFEGHLKKIMCSERI